MRPNKIKEPNFAGATTPEGWGRHVLLVVALTAVISGILIAAATGSAAAIDGTQDVLLESDTTVVYGDGYPNGPPTYPEDPSLEIQTVPFNSSWTSSNISVENPSGTVQSDQTPGMTDTYTVAVSSLVNEQTYTILTDAGESYNVTLDPDATSQATQTSKIDHEKIENADSITLNVDTDSLDGSSQLSTTINDGTGANHSITVERYINDSSNTTYQSVTVPVNESQGDVTLDLTSINDIQSIGPGSGILTQYTGSANQSTLIVPDTVTSVNVEYNGSTTTLLGSPLGAGGGGSGFGSSTLLLLLVGAGVVVFVIGRS